MGILDKVIGIAGDIVGDKDKKPDDDKKSKADFSDVKSGSSSTTPAKAPAAVGSSRTYTVVSGDTLSKIAKREYGDAARWPLIHQANRDKVPNPDLIHPGQVLTLPRDG